MLKQLFKKLKCKLFSVCGSKCQISLNDTDSDGIPDEIIIKET